MSVPFVHLRLHTEFSLVDSLVRVDGLMAAAAAEGMPAVALTDQSNLFAMVKFYRAAVAHGIKPIVGVDLWLAGDDGRTKPARLVLLCQNDVGYRTLTRFVSRTYLEGLHRGVPMLQRRWFDEGGTDGLIALSGAREGDIGHALAAGRDTAARSLLEGWRRLFPDRFYVEVQRTGRDGEERYLQAAVALAADTGTPLVATNDVRFLARGDFEAHEARVCIQEGHTLTDPGRPRRFSPDQNLRSPAEMSELFADLPEALENAVEIARRCNLELEFDRTVLPDFPLPDGVTADEFLRSEAERGLRSRLEDARTRAPSAREPYGQRLAEELAIICRMGYPGYFLIVADFIRWAREHDIPVGPGRGSGAGSLVAYALGITDLDPLEHELLFERFLNPERVSMPDFDIDFCMDGRDRVIDYVAERYGRDRVSQIITYGTMAARAVVRERYSLARMVEQVESVYKEVTGDG